ncbi:MAG: hypothetical protein KDI64_15095, partial [Candidatus Accumulibacter sp.]|nr:hypothetical protein [Accumulibacter sp.]
AAKAILPMSILLPWQTVLTAPFPYGTVRHPYDAVWDLVRSPHGAIQHGLRPWLRLMPITYY